MPSICIDIDNVLAQTDEVMREVIRECSGDRVELTYDDVVCFDYWMCRDRMGRRFDKSEWDKIQAEFTRNHLFRIRPLPNIQEKINQISEKFEVHLVTSRLEEGRDHTFTWLTQHQIPYHQLHYVRHGEKHLVNHRFTAAVDDDREQGYAFHAKGVSVFLLAHPWNHIGPHSPLRRVANWDDLTKEILMLPV